MVQLWVCRLTTNAVLAFLFIYIDVISRENTDKDRGDVVLIAIAVYGTAFMLLKTVLAVYNHLKWMCCIKCCTKPERESKGGRMNAINNYWKEVNKEWNTKYFKNSLPNNQSYIVRRPK